MYIRKFEKVEKEIILREIEYVFRVVNLENEKIWVEKLVYLKKLLNSVKGINNI